MEQADLLWAAFGDERLPPRRRCRESRGPVALWVRDSLRDWCIGAPLDWALVSAEVWGLVAVLGLGLEAMSFPHALGQPATMYLSYVIQTGLPTVVLGVAWGATAGV